MLDVRIFDRIPNDAKADHCVDDRGEPSSLDVRLVVPFEGLHESTPIHRNPFPQLGRNIGHLRFAAHAFLLDLDDVEYRGERDRGAQLQQEVECEWHRAMTKAVEELGQGT